MSFISYEYLFILLGTFIILYNVSFQWQRVLLLAASYIFYGMVDVQFILLILISTVVDYFCAIKIENNNLPQKRKDFLILSLAVNLGLLGYFKYYYFFSDNINRIWNYFDYRGPFPYIDIVLPVAISFYTFQTIGYTVDVYKKRIKAERNFFNFALYVSYFPQLVAGPIERSKSLLPQLSKKISFNSQMASEGLLQISVGIFKKLVIAENLNLITSLFYSRIEQFNPLESFIALVCFSIQVYCDFSGYTDMAIGSAKLLGVRLQKNFDHPYGATSLAQLWKKWHISLTSWFGDYVYKELLSIHFFQKYKFLCVIIVFLLMGLWHGPSWAFISFGLFNAIGLFIERPIIKLEKQLNTFFPSFLYELWARMRTQFFWIVCGQGFIVSNFTDIPLIFSNFLKEWSLSLAKMDATLHQAQAFSVIVCWILLYLGEEILSKNKEIKLTRSYWPFMFLLWCTILVLGKWKVVEFIYYRF